MIDKSQVHTTMQTDSIKRQRVTLAWDSEATRLRHEGKERYDRRPSGAPYNTYRWHKLAKAFIQDHPLCEECERNGVIKAAECVDHIDPWPICKDYFFDRRNLQALCNECNHLKGQRDKARIQEWKRGHPEGVGGQNLSTPPTK